MRRDMTMTAAVLAAVLAAQGAATSFSGSFRAATTWRHTKTVGAAELAETIPTLYAWTHADGTNDWQMDAFVSASGTLGPGATNTVDLSAAQNAFGDAVDFRRVAFFALRASVSNQAAVAASWPGWSASEFPVAPGGLLLIAAPLTNGYTVGAATNLFIRNASASTNALYDLYIGGARQ